VEIDHWNWGVGGIRALPSRGERYSSNSIPGPAWGSQRGGGDAGDGRPKRRLLRCSCSLPKFSLWPTFFQARACCRDIYKNARAAIGILDDDGRVIDAGKQKKFLVLLPARDRLLPWGN